MNERRVATSRITLSVREHPGGDPPVLGLHGLASNARWWDLVAAALQGSHRLVAVDLRGHGLSDKPATGYGFDEITADLVALVDALELPPLMVAGHSWGAGVAETLAAAIPDRVLGVLAVEGGVGSLREVFDGDWSLAEVAMRPPDLVGVPEELVRGFASGQLAEGSDADTAAEILLGNFEPSEGGGLRPRLRLERHMEIARALFELDSAEMLDRLSMPISVVLAESGIAGRDSRRPQLEAQIGRLPNAELHWVDGGHDLPVQRPREVAQALRALADRVARPQETA